MEPIQLHFNGTAVALLFGILQGVLILYLFFAKKIYKEHPFFLLFIAILLFALLESLFIKTGYIQHLLFFVNSSTPFILLLGPLLYAYTLKQTEEKVSATFLLLHCVPFIFYFGYSFNFFLQPEVFKYNAIVSSFYPEIPLKTFVQQFSEDPWNIRGWVVVEFITLHFCIYSMLSFLKIYNWRRINKFKDEAAKIRWVTYLNFALLLSAVILFFSQGGVVNEYVFMKSPFPHYSSDFGIIFIMYIMTAYLAINQNTFEKRAPKYQKSTIPSYFKSKKLKELKSLIESEKLYLSNNFSLDFLSQKSGLTKHHVSQILNEELNSTFFELTNKYRIEEAKKILSADEYVKIEQLAYDLGYKSKSTFFKAFKERTLLTPTEFRKIQLD